MKCDTKRVRTRWQRLRRTSLNTLAAGAADKSEHAGSGGGGQD